MLADSSSTFSSQLSQAGHVQRFSIASRGERGWEVREERDGEVVRRVLMTDWHRVERARSVFTLKIDLLRSTGWIES